MNLTPFWSISDDEAEQSFHVEYGGRPIKNTKGDVSRFGQACILNLCMKPCCVSLIFNEENDSMSQNVIFNGLGKKLHCPYQLPLLASALINIRSANRSVIIRAYSRMTISSATTPTETLGSDIPDSKIGRQAGIHIHSTNRHAGPKIFASNTKSMPIVWTPALIEVSVSCMRFVIPSPK